MTNVSGLPAGLHDGARRLLPLVIKHVRDQHGRAFGRKSLRTRRSDTTRPACYQRNAAFKFPGHGLLLTRSDTLAPVFRGLAAASTLGI
jgi:hypothetical protein